MKSKFLAVCLTATVAAVLILIGGHSGLFSSAQAQPAPPSSGDVQPASTALPPNIPSSGPLAEVIKLVQAGVDENIITTYINNSGSTFNLDADKIIYLDNVGVPKDLVSAMMQRDQVLQAQMAAASAPPPPPPPAPETTATYATDVAPEPEPQPEPEAITVNYFYTSLQPYGNWFDVPGYGRCWRPTVVVYNPGWQPYCDRGQWVNSDAGWYWNSDYSWGVTFHYGRWFLDPRYGWCWWPDTLWAPSWVTWRYANDYCGWAPLPPFAVWQAGVGFTYQGSGVSVSFDFGLAPTCFTFVPIGHFCDPHPRSYRCAPAEVTRIYNHTMVINNINFDSHNRTVINSGIPVQHIATVTHTTIRPVPVRELRASAGQPWRNAQYAGQNHAPGAAVGNSPHLGSGFENMNNSALRGEAPVQNRYTTQQGNYQNPQPNRNWTAPGQPATGAATQNHYSQPANGHISQEQARDFGDDKRVTSPHGQQVETPPPHFTPPPASPPPSQSSQSSSRSDKDDQNGNGRGH